MTELYPNKLVKLGNDKIKYQLFKKYILRTPYLSFKEVNDLDINKLRSLCSKPEIAEAIFLASPDLHQEMLKYLNKQHEAKDDKLVFSLLKYLLRMGTRCTPFGMFSGCSVGKIENETNVVLKKSTDFKRVTRLDMNYLCALSQKLETNKEIRHELTYYPNTSLYQIGDEIRFVEYQFINTNRKHFLMSIDANDFINEIINKSKNGVTIDELTAFIIDPEISIDDAIDFVHELIDNQILISSISPTVTGKDYFEILKDEIKSEPIKILFDKIKSKLNDLDNNKSSENLLLYQEITDMARSFDIEVNNKFLFQTDLNVTYFENKLDKSIIENVKEALNILCKISTKKENEKLNYFKKKFYERFEEEEIPLTLALDVETGIGFGEEFEDAGTYFFSELIDDLPSSNINVDENSSQTNKIAQTKFTKLLLTKLLTCFRNKESIIELKEEDFKDFKDNWNEVPNTFSTMIRVLEVNDSKPLIYLSGFGGATASYLINRFSHIDTEIYNYIEEILAKEKHENVIFAEIVHLPQARVGNVLSRTDLREYEIPYLAKSALPIEKQITITDLLVSIRNGRIILRSKMNNKQVIPVLSNAHNFDHDPLPIYSFLASMQSQNKREYFGFKWGDFLVDENYLPRIMYKNIIFSFATWIVIKNEMKTLNNIDDLKLWLQNRRIPSKVQISDFDNNLLIDFENELSSLMFLSIIKTKDYVILKEYLFEKDKAIVNKENQGMENEIILSFYKENL